MFVFFLFGHCNVCPFSLNGQREKGQTLQWPKRKRTNIAMAKEKNDEHYNDQREKGQTLQWPKRKKTNITMTKEKKDKHYNGQREKRQTFIVMFVLFLFGHCNVCPFSLWPL
jgi:hypothetical protein